MIPKIFHRLLGGLTKGAHGGDYCFASLTFSLG